MFSIKTNPNEETHYPDPPEFYKKYTKEGVRRGTCPPPPPVPQKFRVFGREYDLDSVSIFTFACVNFIC